MVRLHQFPNVFSLHAHKTIGIMGGSFNPAHDGHNHIADRAVETLGLDELWWLVSPQNPLKTHDGMAAFDARLKTALSVARHSRHAPRMRISPLEAHLGTRLTYQTLTHIRRRSRGAKMVWIMGSDNLMNFHRWRRPDVISRTMAIAVVSRPGSQQVRSSRGAKIAGQCVPPRRMRIRQFPPRHWCYIQGKLNHQSATAIRQKQSSV